jgi:MFS family permease
VLLTAATSRRSPARAQSVRSAVRRLAASRLISMAGTDATGVAIGFALYEQTRSATWLSLSLMLTVGGGTLLAPLAGRVGDLVDRRRLMIGAELAACAVFVTLALVHTPVALLALGVLASAIGTLFGPASGAAIGHVAGDRHLTWASGVIATAANVGRTAGRLLAGVLIAGLGVTSVFLLDALTFLISAWLIASVRRALSEARTRRARGDSHAAASEAEPRGADASEREGGMRHLLGDRTLRALVLTACISTFATAFTMTAEVPLVFEIGAGAIGLGALTACWGAGMAAGSWYAGRRLGPASETKGVLVGRLAMAAGVGVVAVAPGIVPMLACYLLGGVGGGFMGVAAQSLILRRTPDRLRARTLGTIEACRNTAFGLGIAGAGAMVGLAGPRPVYAAVGVAMALGTLPVAAVVFRLGAPRRLGGPLPA